MTDHYLNDVIVPCVTEPPEYPCVSLPRCELLATPCRPCGYLRDAIVIHPEEESRVFSARHWGLSTHNLDLSKGCPQLHLFKAGECEELGVAQPVSMTLDGGLRFYWDDLGLTEPGIYEVRLSYKSRQCSCLPIIVEECRHILSTSDARLRPAQCSADEDCPPPAVERRTGDAPDNNVEDCDECDVC